MLPYKDSLRFRNWTWRLLCNAEDVVRVAAIVGMTVLVFISILLRLLLSWASPAWDEIARYLMIWSIMAGAIVTSREDEHIKMGFFRYLIKTEKQTAVYDFLIALITLVFLCFFLVWSYDYLSFSLDRGLRSIVTDIPMAFVHASFFTGISISCLHFIIHVWNKLQHLLRTLKK